MSYSPILSFADRTAVLQGTEMAAHSVQSLTDLNVYDLVTECPHKGLARPRYQGFVPKNRSPEQQKIMSRINAAVSPVEHAVLARSMGVKAPMRAVNDNHDCFGSDELLRETLRHFAEFGLGAAEKACANAQASFFAGDRESYRRWLAICRALDQRMASAIAFRMDRAG